MLENWKAERDETTQSSPLPFFFLRSALFSFRLFSLRSFPTFPVEQRAQEPTSFPMHQEDVRTAWPGSFHPSRFRHRIPEISPRVYIHKREWIKRERERKRATTRGEPTSVPSFYLKYLSSLALFPHFSKLRIPIRFEIINDCAR